MRIKKILNTLLIFFSLFFILNISVYALFGSSPPPYHGGSTGGNVSGIISTSPYLYISSIAGIFNILLNETILNATIDDRALGGSFVPYTGATGDIDLNNKSITNINIINATTGYFSNHTVYIGTTKLSSNQSTLYVNNGEGNVSANYYFGSAKYLTEINITGGNIDMAGNNISNTNYIISNYFQGYLDHSYIVNPPWIEDETDPIWTAASGNYYNKTQIDTIISNLNISTIGGNGTIIEVVNCDGTCSTVIETEYS